MNQVTTRCNNTVAEQTPTQVKLFPKNFLVYIIYVIYITITLNYQCKINVVYVRNTNVNGTCGQKM